MSRRDEQIRERRLKRLAESELRVHERLLSVRDEIDALGRQIDRVTVPRRRSRRNALGTLGLLSGGFQMIRGDRS